MNWNTAQNWIGAMNSANYLGFNDWRLPTVTDTGAPGISGSWYDGTGDHGYNTASTGEMAHLWYSDLGNLGYVSTSGAYPQAGWGLTNTGPFSNVQSYPYWSGTEYAPNTYSAWGFYTGYGYQDAYNKNFNMFAWAVRPGQSVVAAVPEPEMVAMLLAGLGVLGFTARRRKLWLWLNPVSVVKSPQASVARKKRSGFRDYEIYAKHSEIRGFPGIWINLKNSVSHREHRDHRVKTNG
ncbi:MAG: DUF1566 domain-containing protein [Nitrosomonadales bacterium]|nr:DUF1566 domain-containing protein [Nitrosomonadales bacterium]